jgi:hypothetical protein
MKRRELALQAVIALLVGIIVWSGLKAFEETKNKHLDIALFLRIYDDPASPPWLKAEARKRLFPNLEESK